MRKLLTAGIAILLSYVLFAPQPPAAAENNVVGFNGFPDRPPPTVPPREEPLTFYPCSQCHEFWRTNESPRTLAPVHEVGLQHGEGRLWCLDCHSADDRDQLTTLRSGNVGFDEVWKVCGQCHANRQRDWYYGAHGKRGNGWQSDPVRYDCTHCHNPHQPPFMTRKPGPPPPVRVGLEPMDRPPPVHTPIWERKSAKTNMGENDE